MSLLLVRAGGVGRHFLSQLSLLQHTLPHISLVLISRSSKSLRASHRTTPLSLSTWERDLEASTSPPLTIDQTLAFLNALPHNRILVDNTSSQAVANAYPSFLTNGISIITPNKKAFSSSLALWDSIRQATHRPTERSPTRGLLYHESSVGAGLPIISTLTDLLATGDTVHRIEGVFSGTMSFLFNHFAPLAGTGGPWSAEVVKAKAAGFTEPDPREDLNGLDVARKLVILARLVGVRVEGTDAFEVQSLVPEELVGEGSVEGFMERLPAFDARMEEVRDEAVREGKVVRFVGSIDVRRELLKVGLEKLDRSSPVAGLAGSDNVVSFYTERYGENPLVVRGAGAGGAVTAMGVTADLIKVVQRLS
ncbi:homoserine dehydrogenase-domain-containing protein [Usnea florida]